MTKIYDSKEYDKMKDIDVFKCTLSNNNKVCEFETKVYKKFKSHVLKQHGDSNIILYYKYGCTEGKCSHFTDDLSKYNRHMEKTGIHKNQKTFKCELCQESFYTQDNLNDHVKTHSDEKLECKYEGCNGIFSTPNSLRNHVRVYHEEIDRVYTCKYCKENFFSKSKHDYHVQKDHKDYTCYLCCQNRICSGNLRRHLINVHNIQLYSCNFPDCDVSFYKNEELNEHLKQVHKIQEKLVFCDECSYYIDTQERLDSHKYYVHPTEKKVYPCIYDHCDYVGKHPSKTKRHVQTQHSLERPFFCNECDATFKQKECLKQHLSIHSNEKKFHCDKCIYKTITQSRLTSHKYWHDKVYKFQCHLCPDKIYPRFASLERHYNDSHSPDLVAHVKKKKEYQVFSFLKEKGIDIQPNYTVNLMKFFNEPCLFVDFYFEYNDIFYLLEVDEEMHSRYGVECDSNRMHKICNYLFLINEQRPVVFLRYNPDNFNLDGKRHTKDTYLRQDRMNELYEFITTYKTANPYSIKYFFYNSVDGTTTITEHPEYNQHMKHYII